MKKGIFCLMICVLMVLTAVIPISATTSWNETNYPTMPTDIREREVEKIVNELQIKLDTVTTQQEALILFKETIVALHNQGLLPKGMSVRPAQRLVTMELLKNNQLQSSQRGKRNDTSNTNCLVIGIATETFFLPHPAILYDFPMVNYLVFNGTLSPYLRWLALFYILRSFSPVKVGSYAEVGGRYKVVIDGNITDNITPAIGVILTIGENDIQKWHGSFYGNLYTRYKKTIYENDSHETWDPVGIRGFFGISYVNIISSMLFTSVSLFFIGFAREINMTYTPPWT